MPQFVWVIDTTLVSMVYIFSVAVTLGWVFHGTQTRIPRNGWTIVGVSTRLAIIFVVLLLFSAVNGLASWVTLLIAALPFVIALTGTHYAAVGCIAVVYLVQQYVLGFPDRDQWVLEADSTPLGEPDPLHMHVGKQIMVTAALRPSGHVFINEQKTQCESDDGCFIEAGVEVVVREVRDGRLIVRRLTNC